jgi:hypothetical protein
MFKNQWDDTGYGTSRYHFEMNLWIISGRSMMKFQVVWNGLKWNFIQWFPLGWTKRQLIDMGIIPCGESDFTFKNGEPLIWFWLHCTWRNVVWIDVDFHVFWLLDIFWDLCLNPWSMVWMAGWCGARKHWFVSFVGLKVGPCSLYIYRWGKPNGCFNGSCLQNNMQWCSLPLI